jgi:UDP-N-acetyl-D-glucosamine dehydrogenase
VDYYLAFSPEREDPGNKSFNTTTIPRIVSGDGDGALAVCKALFDEIIVKTVSVPSMEVAEAAKVTENIFRSVNIALVNELKIIYDAMGIDVWDVIDAAKTKPFGFMPFYPGPGLGGHCIPIDPFYLSWRAEQFGHKARFIELAGEINTSMPHRVISILESSLRDTFGTAIKNARILLLGMAYKKNVNDTRESPALELLEILADAGAAVEYFDPYVPEIPPTRKHGSLLGLRSIDWDVKKLASFDAVLVCTDHDNVDYGELVRHSRLVVDTRNVMKNISRGEALIVKA